MENKKGKIFVLGSCSVDFTTYSERLPSPGETLHGYKFMRSNGGKGANQCVAATKLGGKTAMVARVGSDVWGRDYIQTMSELGIDTTHMMITENESTGIAQINVSKCGENQIVIVTGANKLLSVKDVEAISDDIYNAPVLVCQLETPIEATLRAFKLCKGVKILNAAPGVANLSKELLSLASILCVNESEASIITGRVIETLSNVALALKELLTFGCETVIVTLGSNGAAFATKMDPHPKHILSQKVTAVDTTGAGDAFIGALATLIYFDPRVNLSKAVGAACYVAAMSVTKEGTQNSYPQMNCVALLDKEYVITSIA